MPRVLLYGRSLLISGLLASLGAVSGVEVKDVEAQMECLNELLSAWIPDVLIFDLCNLAQVPSLALLNDYPDLLLIGLDTQSSHLRVFSNRQQRAESTNDLIKVIQQGR